MSELGFQRLQEQLKKLRQEAVTHPNQVMMQIKVPAEIAAALGTGRGGLVMLGGGWERPHSQEQMKDIYRLISTLIDANYAFSAHSKAVMQLVANLQDHMKGLQPILQSVRDFAEFKLDDEDRDD